MESDSIERLLKQDRQVVMVTLVLVTTLAWLYTLFGVGMEMTALEMTPSLSLDDSRMTADKPMMNMPEMSMAIPQWDLGYSAVMLAMWWMMMIAMMLPSATPIILLASALNRCSNSTQPPYGKVSYFIAGYLLVWLFFSGIAVIAQWYLEKMGIFSAMMQSSSSYLNAALLLAAGIWQLTPIKQACLRHCRSPVHYLTQHRRAGNSGALLMGVGHGSYCLGCCWFLMALLFVGGVMNLYWIIGLALYVLAEKVLPYAKWFSRVTGVALILASLSVFVLG